MILAFPYYDPRGMHNQAFERQLATLESSFDGICVSAIPPTSKDNDEFVQYLGEQGCVVFDNAPDAPLGNHSRAALRLSLECARAQQAIFFGFLDRILFALETEWRASFLQDLETYQAVECVVFERSQRAWRTHPSNCREMEHMVSRVFELLWGRFIQLSPCGFILSYATANTILNQSRSASYDVWGEWVLLAMKNNIPTRTQKADWLTWEHPYWEGIEPEKLKQSREGSREETIRRIRMNVPIMLMLAEERFRHLGTSSGKAL